MRSVKKAICVLFAFLFVFAAALPVFAADDCEHELQAVTTLATCTEEGYVQYFCPKCGYLSEPTEIVPPYGHKYGVWTATQKASCTQNGLWERTCDYCDSVETKTTPVLAHADLNADGKCDTCGTNVPFNDEFSPFDWFMNLINAIKQFFAKIQAAIGM